MKNRDPLAMAEGQRLSAQSRYAHKLTEPAYIEMLKRQVAYWLLVAERRGEASSADERSRWL